VFVCFLLGFFFCFVFFYPPTRKLAHWHFHLNSKGEELLKGAVGLLKCTFIEHLFETLAHSTSWKL